MLQGTFLKELIPDEIHQTFGHDGREVNDFYPTDPRLVRPLLDKVPLPKTAFEPMSGKSAIANVLRDEGGIDVVESDIQWDMEGKPKDATDRHFWEYYAKIIPKIGLNKDADNWATVTNPAFDVAPEFMRLAFKYSPWGVVALLRLSFIEPCEDRCQWVIDNSDHLRMYMPINPRHKFKPGGNDSVTTAWYWYDPHWSWKALGLQCPFQFISNWR